MKVGDIAGSMMSHGYRRICIDNRVYLAHRLAWLYMTGEWPKHQIDHINGNKNDNRHVNLREATNSENMRNTGKRSDNSSGFKGVYWNSEKMRWSAQISYNGRHKSLGTFDTAEEAHVAYRSASEKLHGQFARAE